MKKSILAAAVLVATGALTFAQDNTLASPWGITSSASSSRTYPQWMPKISDAGITWARMFVDWGAFEPQPHQWRLDAADKMLDVAAANHIHLSGMFCYSAQWARPKDAKGSPFPMDHLDDWAEYIGKVVDHDKDRVHYWEIWNEPNGSFHGHYPDGHSDTTADYTKLVERAYDAAKASDPNAQIGISTASYDAPFIDQVILNEAQDGKKGAFDYLIIHPYETIGSISEADGEIPYLWMAKMLRDALKVDAPDKANCEIWITEVGRVIGKHKESKEADEVTPQVAAQTLVKAYLMAMAQGIAKICWFEAQDPHGEPPGYGVLDINGEKRPSWTALKSMTNALGETPKYVGWLALGSGNRSYGFVFAGEKGPVLAIWMPKGETDNTIKFAHDVDVIDPLTNNSTALKAGDTLALTESPVLITKLPLEVTTQAAANAPLNFPWGGDYSKETTVSCTLGDPNINDGVIQVARDWTTPYVVDGKSIGAVVSAPGKHDNQNIKFIVHPSFANLKQHDYYIRVTARRQIDDSAASAPSRSCNMSLVYEVADSHAQGPMRVAGRDTTGPDLTDYKGSVKGDDFIITPGAQWQTHTWHVTDACFAKMWAYDFAFLIGDSNPIVISKVEVSTKPFAN